METDVPSARCWHRTGHRTEVTGKALITFKLSSALSPTSHLFSSTSLLHLSLTPPWTPRPSKEKLPTCFFCTAGTLPVPPHLSELEDASCADILGRGHLDWAVLPVLIQLQDLNPQLHFAGHLTPPAQRVKCWVVSFVWLFFSPQEKKELKHQNTELRLQMEAATMAAINAPFVSTQVPAVQCF